MDQDSTIVAVSTAMGGAIALLRLSGSNSINIAESYFESASGVKLSSEKGSRALYGNIVSGGEVIDDVIVTLFRNPHSYTGEDMVEVSSHGSPYIVQRLLSLFIEGGAKLADRGEFTMRAYLAGKMDLVQAEAVADLIASTSAAQHRLALRQMKGGYTAEFSALRADLLHFASMLELELDFGEEDVEFASREELTNLLEKILTKVDRLISSFDRGDAIKKGIPVCIAGSPNVGKSTLLNRLIGEERAIVSDIAGTTRDVIEDTISIGGVLFRLIDTAGLRATDDKLESLGIDRTFTKISASQLVLYVTDTLDQSQIQQQLSAMNLDEHQDIIILLNKCDKAPSEQLLSQMTTLSHDLGIKIFALSALTGYGIDAIEQHLSQSYDHSNEDDILITNTRHLELLKRASEGLMASINAVNSGLPTDLTAQDIRHVLSTIGEITGEITTGDILQNIFKNFCIGK